MVGDYDEFGGEPLEIEPEVEETEGEPLSPETEEVDPELELELEEPVAPRPMSPANVRIQKLIEQRKASEAEAAFYRGQAEALRAQQAQPQPQPQPPVVDTQEEARRMDMMSDAERVQYLVEKGMAVHQQELRRVQMEMAVQQDRALFEAYLVENPGFAVHRDVVERTFAQQLARGAPVGRDIILSWAIGEEAKKAATKSVAKAKQAGAANITRQTTKPASPRSTVSPASRKEESAEETLKRRLEGGAYW